MIEGLNRLLKKLDKVDDEMLAAAQKGYLRAAVDIKSDIVRSIQERSSGAPYTRYKNGKSRTGVASLPGDAPNTDTGQLVKSIFFEKRGKDIVVGSNNTAVEDGVHYGAVLELSTNPKMKRPWLAPAISKNRENLKKKVKQEIKKALR